MVCQANPVAASSRRLDHNDAYLLSNLALRAAAIRSRGDDVIIDLSKVEEITTAALARLVLLRRQLKKHGRDLKIVGLRSRAEKLFEINRLSGVLPRS